MTYGLTAYETRTHTRLSDGVRVTACGPGVRRRRWPGSGRLSNGHAPATATRRSGLIAIVEKRSSGRRRPVWAAGDLPTPNVYATRTASGHAQVFYLLDRPVHRGEHARVKPLQHLARVSEYYRATFGADAGYMGVLSSNPVHDDYQTSYPRAEPYALADLARVIPKGWRVPRPATTAEGRNNELFAALCKLALRCSDDGLLTWARTLNIEFAVSLPDGEVRGVWRSVCRYRARWREQGHQQGWLWRQAARARKGGVARAAKLALRDSQWSVMHHNGFSYRDIARVEGMSHATVIRAVRRSHVQGGA